MTRDMSKDVRNIMFNLSAGLLPENLSKEEVSTLKSHYGDDWFFRLGYSEKKYKKPDIQNE